MDYVTCGPHKLQLGLGAVRLTRVGYRIGFDKYSFYVNLTVDSKCALLFAQGDVGHLLTF